MDHQAKKFQQIQIKVFFSLLSQPHKRPPLLLSLRDSVAAALAATPSRFLRNMVLRVELKNNEVGLAAADLSSKLSIQFQDHSSS